MDAANGNQSAPHKQGKGGCALEHRNTIMYHAVAAASTMILMKAAMAAIFLQLPAVGAG